MLIGRRSIAMRPPLSLPGVMLVMLSTNRWVATSVSFILMSRLTEATYSPSWLKTVPSAQSE